MRRLALSLLVLVGLLLPGLSTANIIASKLKSAYFYWPITPAYIHSQQDVPVFSYQVLQRYPHNPHSFTQGLVLDQGLLYESAGLYGQSKLMKINLQTGKSIQSIRLPDRVFAEGITLLNDEIFQLTYRAKMGFVYDKKTLKVKRQFYYPSQGWGLTTDGQLLIMSDGSAILRFYDPYTLQLKRQLCVTDGKRLIGALNALQYVDGQIYANIWQSDIIARISAKTGKVTAWLDLTGLNPDQQKLTHKDVLNGLAYDKHDGSLIVTGKRWRYLYKLKLINKVR